MGERRSQLRLRWRAKRVARRLLTLLARPSYGRSLNYLTGRDELPRLLNRRGLLGVGAEVGVRDGEFSEHLLREWRGRRLISVDAWDRRVDPNGDYEGIAQAEIDATYERARGRLGRFGERSEIVRRPSVEAAAEIAPGSLDFVYIDAAHDLASVRADLAAWYPRVRPGGILAGHDYLDGPLGGMTCGVRSAVDEFSARAGLEVGVTLRDAPLRSWFVRVPEPTDRR